MFFVTETKLTGDKPTVEFDHHSPEHASDPLGSFARVESKCPVAWSESHGGYWILTDYDAVAAAARDAITFSSAYSEEYGHPIFIPSPDDPFVLAPLELDPPDFAPYRRFLHPFLTQAAVRGLESGLQYWVDFFLDQVIESGRMELVEQFATPVPSTITIDWLGLKPTDWPLYAETVHLQMKSRPGTEERRRADAGYLELVARVDAAIRDRRRHPQPDIITLLANAKINGEPVPHELALGTLLLTINGGVNTTAVLVSHALIYLSEHRGLFDKLLQDDRFMRTSTEELLRHYCPILSIGRQASRSTELHDQHIEARDHVLLAWAAANHDAAKFEDPYELRLDRWPNPHLAFGLGPHRCIGSNLARAMFANMLRAFLKRVPDFRITNVTARDNRSIDNAFEAIDIEFTPGSRVLPQAEPSPQFRTSIQDSWPASAPGGPA
jgi:cytochrome P450